MNHKNEESIQESIQKSAKASIEAYLDKIPSYAKKKAELSEVQAFLAEMGNPQEQVKIIHVAGTNGKGSVCAYLVQILKESGQTAASFPSPHLVETRERFLLNGVMIDNALYEACFEEVRQLCEKMMKKGYSHPMYFEFLFYMQMALVKHAHPDWLVLEAGMGGRRDVTNAVEHPVLTILTSISMDHMQYLGNTLEEIAWEKAGIIKAGVPVIFAEENAAVADVIRREAEQKHSPCIAVSGRDWEAGAFDLEQGGTRAKLFGKECMVPFAADYQAENAALAFRAIMQLSECTEEMALLAISHTKWPGRMEQVLPGVYLDGAHNEGGIHALTSAIRKLYHKRDITILFSAAKDKAHDKMLRELCQTFPIKAVVGVSYSGDRSMPIEEIKRELESYANCPVFLCDTVKEAFETALSQKGDGLLFAAGSLYLIGEIKDVIRRQYHD